MSALDRLAEIEQRAGRATPGPWMWDSFVVREGEYPSSVASASNASEVNAKFIAHARTDVPALVAALRAVLDIHKPATVGPRTVCDSCLDSYEDYVDYPCPEVATITEALGGGA